MAYRKRVAPEKLPAVVRHVTISAPVFETVRIPIAGTSALVVNRFSEKQRNQMRTKQEAGARSRRGQAREAKDFKAACEAARYVSREGWDGVPAIVFRSAMIAACGIVGFRMTNAKKCIVDVIPDGYDRVDGEGLVRIHGKWHMDVRPERNATGTTDLRSRPMFSDWEATVCVQFDTLMFTAEDIANLMLRAGLQIGICEGRPDSRRSNGRGWGRFTIGDMARIDPAS